VRQQGGADQVDPDPSDELGGAGAGELLGDDEMLDGPRAAPAVLRGPGDTDPAIRGEAGLPFAKEGDFLGEVVEPWGESPPVLPGKVVAQPGPEVVAEAFFVRGGGEVQSRSSIGT
jgi:hypothetical protein